MDEGALRQRLLAGLDQAANRLERLGGKSLGEQDTKAALVSPVLRALGWDVEDVEQVRHEYRHQSSDRPVDYALLLSRVPQLFVEAKGYGENLADRRWAGQIVSYAAVAGVSWVALTDGNEWRLFNAHAPVDVEEKLFRQVRISEDRTAAAEALGYLARENITRAQEVLSSLWEADRADRAVRAAVEGLLTEDPPLWFVAALTKRIPSLTRGQVRGALERLRVRLDVPPPSALGDGQPVTDAGALEGRGATEAPPPPRPPQRPGEGVGLPELISAGLVKPPLVLTKQYLGRELRAEVQPDGSVICNGTRYRSPSTAAAKAREEVKGGPPAGRAKWQTNGWIFWLFRDEDGSLQPLDVLRRRYREQHGVQEHPALASGDRTSGR
jgi:hypothetical protein